jgi:cytochrome c556
MIKYVIALVAGAIAGAFAGNSIAHRLEEPHHHPRAVMHLLGFHRERLDAASQAGKCATVDVERARLTSLQQEIALAFPKAYEKDADFRKDADALGTVLQEVNAAAAPVATMSLAPNASAAAGATPAAAGSSCPDAVAQFKRINDTCDNCHKVYDPE